MQRNTTKDKQQPYKPQHRKRKTEQTKPNGKLGTNKTGDCSSPTLKFGTRRVAIASTYVKLVITCYSFSTIDSTI